MKYSITKTTTEEIELPKYFFNNGHAFRCEGAGKFTAVKYYHNLQSATIRHQSSCGDIINTDTAIYPITEQDFKQSLSFAFAIIAGFDPEGVTWYEPSEEEIEQYKADKYAEEHIGNNIHDYRTNDQEDAAEREERRKHD